MIELISLFAVFIAIFLFGMTVMRTGLYNLTGDNLKVWLIRFTDTPFKGLLTGTIITAIIHSSSAVMVLVVGLIATGYLTFKQSIGIILGTNIGTTFTAEMITFDIFDWIVPILILGFLCLLISNQQVFSFGAFLFGLGCMFVAMNGFEQLARPISQFPSIHTFFQHTNESSIFGVGVGTILTSIIQSSTATTGIIMGFMNEQLLNLNAGIAVLLGANIGTCITAYIASLGSKHEAKLAAYAHIWVNVLGVMLFFPFIHVLGQVAMLLTTHPDVQIAHVSLIFNVLTSLLFLPFAGVLTKFIMKIHRAV
ncbi:Na/Pi cotransporter family protein [Bacillus timonensis]|uniref:Na/Pi cotransporter family protein n=1 Tax=Bacillus timonensis TaxID=1033734 RepID=A0A4S3Q0B6_9BACI|nr:Na/Pi symporter [Bacillus timonensis]THE15414.1 Na/Pi cotransporter family protein [Bacillus timonensis]